ncbi:NAD-dependent epimerase/dehydratase family protein [Pacificoceanicola onchidii]|uniref:NAD-dependent epimerase/dehydratase family protein n=1 Tax=Pacificoceanicola onchidii TaxID=2562685 RepID=UPI0010A5EE55|nr:NAD(P)-dependent oxidoreductase [Pacificoceanicola onchidii]
MKRLLITGAAGGLGTALRSRLAPLAETIRLSDKTVLDDLSPSEEFVQCDLGDAAAVEALVQGCDGIVHFGGKSIEGPWSVINNANIQGVINLYEAARKQGKPRIVYASSVHAVGFYPQDQVIDNTAYPRPDGLYGISKVFGEAVAHAYHDKFGQETAIVRIGSCFEEPRNHRMLSTWMSFDDFAAMITRIFDVPKLGCPILYGMSDNTAKFWDNSNVDWLGWKPQDDSERYRAKIDAAMPKPAPDAADVLWQGGLFCTDDIHEEE